MAKIKSISPLLLFGTTCLLLGTVAYVVASSCILNTPFDIDMSDEDGSEYS